MRQRSPIMINSNYYGFDTLNEHPTDSQSARAANVTYTALLFRRQVERQEVTPFSVAPRTKVPFCTMQYERLFNSCRVPGEEDTLNEHPTDSQSARAANVTYTALLFRRQVERQEVTPFSVAPRTKVPFCTMQYERLFNSCRVPGEEVL
ncbi:hypothetical protein ANCDUO_15764 [Ancylostoma duodenale]|uniref:Choline/carnitine acyltransferase domain-containing protein n=1 Tax=Ancylostoma duodenale TaxID=51022 RepID=A0A0C2GB08_9BILA|nr:hypothetical protein ANCDUO_15764 [Ancylostoma duodenale]